MQRDAMEYDVVIVGGGPAGLAAAIRLKQLANEYKQEISLCLVEKGSEIGAHTLSGAVLCPNSLSELIPDWQAQGAPVTIPVKKDQFLYLTQNHALPLPTPPQMHNQGNYIIRLGQLCRWLAQQAEALGVEIYPGFAATEILYHSDGSVKGIATGDMGLNKQGEKTTAWQPGIELWAKQTLFAEGCRGSLTKTLIERFNLQQGKDPQTYGIGIKEIWEVLPEQHREGLVTHTINWPLDSRTYGGSFIYHLDQHQVAVGFVVGLDYTNPYLSPFEEFQRFKTHPAIRKTFAGGRRIAYGARALTEGGWQSLPKLTFPGGVLIGDGAGFLNVPKIKGIHTAIKSATLAAESVFEALHTQQTEASTYPTAIHKSWLADELYQVRNIRPAFRWGLWPALIYSALDTYLLRGKAPWTLHHHKPDHACLQPADHYTPIAYPKPDGTLTFDRLSSIFLANLHHNEDQPCHLQLINPDAAIQINLKTYAAPEQRYCPANVYEIVGTDNPRLKINPANCIHCKTCDIKDPTQNIQWVPPEGGNGPNYPNL